jgi:hypothetical protein
VTEGNSARTAAAALLRPRAVVVDSSPGLARGGAHRAAPPGRTVTAAGTRLGAVAEVAESVGDVVVEQRTSSWQFLQLEEHWPKD